VPDYDVYIFDLDGTLYLGDELLPGAASTIAGLRQRGKVVRFLSNNPTKTPEQYADKLTRLGIPVAPDEVTNTITTTLWWLRQNHPQAALFPIAEKPLCDALLTAGFVLTDDPAAIDIVIASYDRNFVYRDLQIAFDALWYHHRAILIQTNPDRYCPFPGGRGEPDAAAITAAIEACTQVKCSASMGKPSPLILHAALAGLDVPLDRCLMTGDRLGTDIQMALDTGMAAAVVFTGETRPGDLTEAHSGVHRLGSLEQLLGGHLPRLSTFEAVTSPMTR
jgi:HAD superfamily hydrolase (TIGR01450 family)